VVRVERATAEHVHQVAALRWDWALGNGRDPQLSRHEFVESFEQWWRDHQHTHLCVVGLERDEVVGFGFVALTPRVPGPHVPSRRSADVQAVFVVPRLRNAGIGGRVVERLVSLAREKGAEHVTVHSSAGAVTAYERAGFVHDPLMLNQTL
jgi:GNAT superfamily N-acetyltransferase